MVDAELVEPPQQMAAHGRRREGQLCHVALLEGGCSASGGPAARRRQLHLRVDEGHFVLVLLGLRGESVLLTSESRNRRGRSVQTGGVIPGCVEWSL